MEKYDIILGITNFRRLSVYLPLIKELGPRYRIGLYRFVLEERERGKTARTDHVFFELCHSLGAQFVKDYPLFARLLILPQWAYTDDQIMELKEHIRFDKCLLLMGMMWGNLYVDRLDGISVNAYLVVDRELYYYRLGKRPDEERLKIPAEKIVEVGLPFKRYPVLKDLDLDYIVAVPTPLSLPEPKDRAAFLENLLGLLEHLDCSQDRIGYKPHNADERADYLVGPLLFPIASSRIVKGLEPLLAPALKALRVFCPLMAALGLKKMNKVLYWFLTAAYYSRLMKRVRPLSHFTPYHNFSLEFMLPQVKKGLVTGRSNTIWHALYLKMPVYNCVDKRTIKEDKSKMNYESMKLFETPFCGGRPTFDESYFKLVRDEVRGKDMVKYIEQTLEEPGA